MSEHGCWPPKSAYEAMMSSPNGRKKLADLDSTTLISPTKRFVHTPSFLDRLRTARNMQGRDEEEAKHVNNHNAEDEDQDEDEETLRLKLAAIEARLKLKELQKARRKEDASSLILARTASDSEKSGLGFSSQVEVPVSPSKRLQLPAESRSPNRVVLGIDKGRRAADVSLRSAQAAKISPMKEYRYLRQQTGRSASIKSRQKLSHTDNADAISAAVETFSERMARSRETDKERASQRAAKNLTRNKDLGIDLKEVERYSEAFESQPHKDQRASLQSRSEPSAVRETSFSREEVVSGRRLHVRSTDDAVDDQSKHSLYEGFSDSHLSSRILPDSFLKRSFPSDRFTIYTIPDLLKVVTSPAYELPDDVCDFVVFGIVASKSQPLDQKQKADEKIKASDQANMKWDDGWMNEKKFIAVTLTDLTWTIDMYLFGTAVPRYHRLSQGTLVAIVNPTIMRPRKGREDTGVFSLSLHNSDDVILEIGQARDLGHCTALKKDKRECGSWIDSSKTSICEYHLNAEIAKTQAGRMGVNTGTNGFGGGRTADKGKGFGSRKGENGLLPVHNGRGYDFESGSHYYITSASVRRKGVDRPPNLRSGMSAAKMLDLDIDDPFIAEGKLARNRDAQMQKRLARQAKEREIAKELSKRRSRTNAGAEYMRKRIVDADNASSSTGNLSSTHPSSTSTSQTQQAAKPDLRSQIGRKRTAQDVQLSPVRKKTRFLTSTGIKETGRESLGPIKNARVITHDKNNDNNSNDDDDDDDLDIV